MDLLDQMHRVAFLGPEFLTWLWFRSETCAGEFALDPAFGDFEVWFEDKLVVGAATVNAQENLFKGGHPAGSLEARTALRLGKFATEAKLRIVRGAQEWTFGLKAHDLCPTGIKIPGVLSKEDDEIFYERMFLVDALDTMLKGLFGLFLKVRLSPRWAEDELPTIQRWIAGEEVSPSPIDPVALGVVAAEIKAPPPDPDAPEKAWPPLAALGGRLDPSQPGFGTPLPEERMRPEETIVAEPNTTPGARPDEDPMPIDEAIRRPGEAPEDLDGPVDDPGMHPADANDTEAEDGPLPPVDAAPDGGATLDVPDATGDDVPPWEAAVDREVPPWEE